MFLHVEEARYLQNFSIWVRFNDDASGIVSLLSELDGEIYEPLKDLRYFKNFSIRGHTISWENGADFAPEFLRARLNVQIPEPSREA